jgi:hypothetical protein
MTPDGFREKKFLGRDRAMTPALTYPSLRVNRERWGPVVSSRRRFYRVPDDADPRVCLRCGERRRFDEFALDRSKPAGRGAICKPCDRAKSKAYYRENRERILARAASKRPAREQGSCSECGELLEGQARVCCGKSKCREARFKRTNPEGYAAREAAKVVRRRERRAEGST